MAKTKVKVRRKPQRQAEPRVIGGSDRDFWGDIDSDVDDAWAKIINAAYATVQSDEDVLKGGPGSGHWAHLGRPGKVGGSAHGVGGLQTLGVLPWSTHSQRQQAASQVRADRRYVQQMLNTTAKEMGFDGPIVYGGDGYPFQVAGQNYKAVAHYNVDDGRIVMFEGSLSVNKTYINEGILAHEISHSRFNELTSRVVNQRAKFVSTEVHEEERNIPYNQRTFMFSGALRDTSRADEFAAMYFHDKLTVAMQNPLLQQEVPKISSYANSYWQRAHASRKTTSYLTAIDETFAEIAKHVHLQNTSSVSPQWMELYNEFLEVSK